MPIYKTVQGHNCIDYELDTHDISEVNMLFIAEKKIKLPSHVQLLEGTSYSSLLFRGSSKNQLEILRICCLFQNN